jgi:beta-phosphoglucomutase family hydrolase
MQQKGRHSAVPRAATVAEHQSRRSVESCEKIIGMELNIPPGAFKAYLFDCDGTIVDSMPLHYIAWQKALAEHNCEFSEELFYAWGGVSVAEVVERLNKKYGLHMLAEKVSRRKEDFYLENLPQLKAIPEVLEQIVANYGKTPLGVVSGSTRESVTASLSALNLFDRFDTLVCAGEYKRGKPDPEAFLLAAANLNVPPESCLVFEDADLGIQAATAAGMAWVKILGPRGKEV